ncbi:MAG: hypothetical protein LBN22_11415 [Clostridiales Family XIII bacterium]|jgi:uncharacterized membrane protein YkvI|nr:hypothetical protein [Clostridiales Family XIII bacterium]
MEDIKRKFSWLAGPFTIAAVWYGIYIGPGFAGGAQLVSFFVGQSWLGVFIGPIVTISIAAIFCYFILEYARIFQLYTFREFYDGVYGKYKVVFANIKDFSAILACITISALSFATGGRLISELFHIPFLPCAFVTIFIIAILILCGQKIVLKSSAAITIALVLLIAYIGIQGVGSAWDGMTEYVSNRTMNDTYPHVILKIILYINILVAFADAAIPASKGVIKSRRDSAATAIIGGTLVILSTLMMNIMFAAGMPDVAKENLPTVWSLTNIIGGGFKIHLLYTTIAYLAVISTGVGYLYGMVERYQLLLGRGWKSSSANARRIVLVIVIALLGMYFGRMGIPDLVTNAYGLIGKINIPLFELPFLVILPYQIHKFMKKKTSIDKIPASS